MVGKSSIAHVTAAGLWGIISQFRSKELKEHISADAFVIEKFSARGSPARVCGYEAWFRIRQTFSSISVRTANLTGRTFR